MDKEEIFRNVITEGSIWRAIKILALPSMAGLLIEDIFNLTDMYFVSYLGADAVAAVSMGGIITGLLIGGSGGLAAGTVALVSRYVGEGKLKDANRIAAQSVVLSIILFFAIGVPCFFLSEKMLIALGAEEAVIAQGEGYLNVIFGGSITIFLTAFLSASLRGAGDATTPMIGLGIGVVANMFLDPIMIHGWFGFPAMGVTGSAVATILTRFIAISIMVYVMLRNKTVLRLKKENFRVDKKALRRIVRIGTPSSVNSTLIHASLIFVVSVVAGFGTSAVAAYGVGIRMNQFITLPTLGFGFASAAIVGQNLGAGKPERSSKGGWLLTMISAMFALPIATLFFIFPGKIMGVFLSDNNAINVGTSLMRIRSPTMPFLAMGNNLTQAINGSGDTFHPLMFTIVSLVITRMSLVYYLPHLLGLNGIWIGMAVSNMLMAALNIAWFRMGRWKRVKV